MTGAPRSYRCHYHPRPDEPTESGVLPYLQVQAADAEKAAQMAFATVGKPIARVERIEATQALEPFDANTDRLPWPLPPAPAALHRAAAKADERRFLAEPHEPSAFGVLA